MTSTPAARAVRVARGRANPELIPHGTLSGYTNWKCRCYPCRDAQLERQRAYRREREIGKIEDRKAWLDHLADCTLCPVDLCDKGVELAAAVRASMAPEETWEWA